MVNSIRPTEPMNNDLKGESQFCNALNRFHDAKNTGVLGKDEFAHILDYKIKMMENVQKNGKLVEGDISEPLSWISEELDKYFSIKHEGLDRVASFSKAISKMYSEEDTADYEQNMNGILLDTPIRIHR